jgi:hypothetical protein
MEYVRSRQVLRFATSGRAGTVEVPPTTLLRELGIDVVELAPTRQFLLFGGRGPATAGGLGDLIAVFRSEAEARDDFRRVRLDSTAHGWAELVALDAGGRLRQICWYGQKNAVPAQNASRIASSRQVATAPKDQAPVRPDTNRKAVTGVRGRLSRRGRSRRTAQPVVTPGGRPGTALASANPEDWS